ncbi:MAG: ATP-binding cassette domain-containing protein [Acholeplasmataceae bacterium]
MKKDHDLRIDNIKYQYNLEKENIENSTVNIYRDEYRTKVAIEKNTYNNKLSGLKDSAALTKEEIELRIEKLKQIYEQNLIDLEKEYEVLIAKGEEERLSKADVAPKLQELKEKRDSQLQREKEKFEAQFAQISVPNHHEIHLAVNEVKERTHAQIVSLKAEIKVIRAKAKEQVLEVKTQKKEAINKFNLQKADNIKVIQDEHEKNLKALSNKYLPLIKQESHKVLSKEDIANDLMLLEEKYNKDLTKLNESKQPKDKVKKEKDKLLTSYNNSKQKLINKTINKFEVEYEEKKQKLQEKTDNSIKIASTYGGIFKDKANKIKAEMKEKIAFEKGEIREIKFANKSKEAREKALEMQMIFQDPIASLNPRMTVKEIIGEGLIIRGKHTKEEIDDEVDKALELVGLSPDYKTRYPHEFSGGQRQRIGIARALIMNPTFIIADEPISALDVSIRAQVINLLTQLKEELGLTILFIAHDLSVVRFFCDRIAVMYYGKIVELAPSEELFAHPMHPYTQSLLSAIPQPDPDYEKGRKRIHYNPMQHDYRRDKPTFREIANGHFVLANEKEFERAKKEYQKQKEGR